MGTRELSDDEIAQLFAAAKLLPGNHGGERTPLKDSIIRLLSTADEQSMSLLYHFAQSLLKSKPAET